MNIADLAGHDLGTRTVRYEDRDAMLYALAVGASAGELDLVYERDLRVLPAYACALGLWAVEAAGGLGAYDRTTSLHAAQKLVMHEPLPAEGELQTRGRISGVWDKGRAAMVDVEVACAAFTATYAIYLPGAGGFGGERGPSRPAAGPPPALDWSASCETSPDQAALYRLTGDRHPVHIDPEIARATGLDGPILHGLCTLGVAARAIAGALDVHPSTLRELEVRMSAPVRPGETIEVLAGGTRQHLAFEARVEDRVVLAAGRATFAPGP